MIANMEIPVKVIGTDLDDFKVIEVIVLDDGSIKRINRFWY